MVKNEHSYKQKAFLGGYRHQLTGTEYHHAAVQTLPRKKPDRGITVFSRDSQTVRLKSHNQQCRVNTSTQMAGIGCYVSCMKDKLVTPGKYITADEWHDRKLRAVIFLQSLARRWLAQKAVDQLRNEQSRQLAWLEMQERRRESEKEDQQRDLYQRRMNPKRREDFNLLYKALEMWRLEEERLINSSQQGAKRKEALRLLLEKETQLIRAIGRRQIVTQTNNYEKMIRDFLNKSASPYQWFTTNNHLIEMDTLHTITARKLQDLYNNISLSTVSKKQRLHLLMTLKETIEENECPLTLDILELIDREVDLMTRKIKAQSLEGLRNRICTLFLQYIKTAAFNPIVRKMLKVSKTSLDLRFDIKNQNVFERAQVVQAATYSRTSFNMEGQKKRLLRRFAVLWTPPWQAIREACPQLSTSVLRDVGTNRVPGGQTIWSGFSPWACWTLVSMSHVRFPTKQVDGRMGESVENLSEVYFLERASGLILRLPGR
uniref:IQ motif and ubiquitin domain containing n=1 Tax=Oryzias latipes TaxID=8090 RepID=A0A3P9LSD5_ORYLA